MQSLFNFENLGYSLLDAPQQAVSNQDETIEVSLIALQTNDSVAQAKLRCWPLCWIEYKN